VFWSGGIQVSGAIQVPGSVLGVGDVIGDVVGDVLGDALDGALGADEGWSPASADAEPAWLAHAEAAVATATTITAASSRGRRRGGLMLVGRDVGAVGCLAGDPRTAEVIEDVRAAEDGDPLGRRWPRFKKHDDASAMHWTL
jgi:hypothetical protein